MGYYTNFSISLIEGDEKEYNEFIKDLEKISGYDFDGEVLPESKWYDSDEHMVKVSKKHPSLIVALTGEGENADDQWTLRVQNGKSEWHSWISEPKFTEICSDDERKESLKKYIREIRKTIDFVISDGLLGEPDKNSREAMIRVVCDLIAKTEI